LSPKIGLFLSYFFVVDSFINDNGWIFQEISVQTGARLENIDSSIYIFSEDDYSSSKIVTLFEIDMYFNSVSNNYIRSYMKIQELAANVGGIIKLVLLLFSAVLGKLSKRAIALILENELFNFETMSMPKTIKNEESKSIILNRSISHQIQIARYHHGSIENKSDDCDMNNLTWKLYLTETQKRSERKPDSICALFSCSKTKSDLLQKRLSSIAGIIDARLDILYYLQILNQVQAMKEILLDENTKYAIGRKNKVSIFDDDRIGQINESIEDLNISNEAKDCKLIDYLINRKKSKQFDEKDEKVFSTLDSVMQSFIEIRTRSIVN
jgi:hypothetical protein